MRNKQHKSNNNPLQKKSSKTKGSISATTPKTKQNPGGFKSAVLFHVRIEEIQNQQNWSQEQPNQAINPSDPKESPQP